MKKLLLPLLFAALLFAACKVTFVPGKSPAAINLLNRIQTNGAALYANIEASADKSFPTYLPQYSYIESEIDSLVTMDKGRKKVIADQDILLQTSFLEYATEHQTKVNINNSEAVVYAAYFKSLVDPRIISENSLK